MTFAEELNADRAMDANGMPEYPKVFGITLTPIASGIGLALLGICGSGYILMNMAMPVWNDFQKISGDKQSKEAQLQQLQGGNASSIVADLNLQLTQKNSLKTQVLGLFASQKTLDTLLLDVNGFIVANQAKLNSFTPEAQTAIIQDSSLGSAVNNKLKRQTYTVALEATFPQIQAIFRSIERLEPLLVVRDFKSEPVDKQVLALLPTQANRGQVVPVSQMKVKTEFKLDAILPLSAEELAKLQPKPAETPAANPEKK
jgi:hypothetical protein